MGRNRKHGSAARFVPAVKAALLCLLLGGSAIGFVYQKNQIIELGKQIQARERKLAQLRVANAKLQQTYMTLQSATTLEERVKKLNLGLAQPLQTQILTIVETPAPTGVPDREQPVGPIARLK
jgi:cell division protein FtsB